MSHNHSDTSQPESDPLVTSVDLASPKCGECGMTAREHQMFGSVRLLCSQTPAMIRRAHWEKIVRREIAKELDRLGNEIDQLDEWPDDKVTKTHYLITERAEEIRND